jgi:hypothetical protein
VLFVLVAITLPELGSDPLRFRPGSVDPQGPLAPLVRAERTLAFDRRWVQEGDPACVEQVAREAGSA